MKQGDHISKLHKFLSRVLPPSQKRFLKKMKTSVSIKQKKLYQLNQIKKHIYSYGFVERGYQELQTFFENENNIELKGNAAWELSLWHANQYTQRDARKAIYYAKYFSDTTSSIDALRKASILTAESLQILNKEEIALKLINRTLKKHTHPDLYFAMSNLHHDLNEKVKWINQALKFYNLLPIEIKAPGEKVYDQLSMKDHGSPIESEVKVSVIMPVFNREDDVGVAIKSLQKQTWTNIEILIVDDCSTDNTLSVVKEYMKKDQRIKLFSTTQNSGPYVARNIGLKNATGQYVTVNDGDDWSHSEKLEIQVKHLINNPAIIANTSEHARVTEELQFYRRNMPGRYVFSNMSSLMFRREEVLRKIGYWDSVRFAGDGEYVRRIKRAFGKSKFYNLKTGPLSFPRQSITSLTASSEFGYHGHFRGVRKEYIENAEWYHYYGKDLYVPFPLINRHFSIPNPMKIDKKEQVNEYNVLFGHDFRIKNSVVYERIIECINQGLKVGLVQFYTFNFNLDSDMHSIYRTLINGEQVQIVVWGENVTSDSVQLTDLALEEEQEFIPEIRTKNIEFIFTGIESSIEDLKKKANKYLDFNEVY